MATIADACDRAARMVHWAKPQNWPMELDRLPVANEVGEWLCSAEEWNWLKRPGVTLSLVASQAYIALPSDFGRLVSLSPVSGSAVRVRLEDQAAVDQARAYTTPGGTLFRGCLAYSAPTATAVPAPLLLLGPVPGVSLADCIRLSYIATWRTCDSESDVIPMPLWMQPLYIRAVALYLAGWERDKGGTVEQRLATLVADPLYMAAVHRDDAMQVDMGPIRNTAEDMIMGGDAEFIYSNQTSPVIGP